MGSLAAPALQLDAVADHPGQQVPAQAPTIVGMGMRRGAISLPCLLNPQLLSP
jgi:hypothetical protein